MVDMTGDRMTSTGVVISDVIADRVRDLRQREGVSREELAERARAAGAPESFTAVVVGFLETGRPKSGRRTRDFAIDEVAWCAAALQVAPARLFGDQWPAFAGAEPAGCTRCAGEAGQIEATLRRDLDAMETLTGLEPSIAAAALRLAQEVDQATGEDVPRLMREFRATLVQLGAGRRRHPEPAGKPAGDEFGDLDKPEAGVNLSGIDASVLDGVELERQDVDELGA